MSNEEQTAVMTIEVGMTQQPESYTSVRRNITLPIFVKPGDDITTIARAKMAEAVKIVEDSIDDDFERGHGISAKYSNEPRYDYIEWIRKGIAVIVPTNSEPPRGWSELRLVERNHRLAHLKKILNHYQTVIDCSQNFTALESYPEIYHGKLIWQPYYKIAILTEDEKEPNNSFKQQYKTETWSNNNWYEDNEKNFYEDLIEWAKKRAEEKECTLYICWNGNLDLIPPPTITQPPEPEPDEDEDDEDEDDDDESF